MSGAVVAVIVLACLAGLCIAALAAAVFSSGQRDVDRRASREWREFQATLQRKPAGRS